VGTQQRLDGDAQREAIGNEADWTNQQHGIDDDEILVSKAARSKSIAYHGSRGFTQR